VLLDRQAPNKARHAWDPQHYQQRWVLFLCFEEMKEFAGWKWRYSPGQFTKSKRHMHVHKSEAKQKAKMC
jgi:hypothetical protein